MVSNYVWIGVVIGVFFVGIGVSYVAFSNMYDDGDDTFPMKFKNQQDFDQMMSQNPKMSQQWMDIQTQEMNISKSGNDESDKKEKGWMKKQQTRNQIGLMIQDAEIRAQVKEEAFSVTSSTEIREDVIATGKSSDNSILVQIKSTAPKAGQFLELIETFHDNDGNILEHVNHEIHVAQDGETVLKMSELHSHYGDVVYWTRELKSDSPIEVEVTINGLGMEEPLIGPFDDVITITIPP